VAKGVEIYEQGGYDLVTNVMPRSYPVGQSVEVIDADVFGRVYASMKETSEHEHITQYFYRHPDNFRIMNFSYDEDLRKMQLSVDTPGDMENARSIISGMQRPHWDYHLAEIVQMYRNLA
jgi:spore coat polysaccharide biosynthesis protein SpsF